MWENLFQHVNIAGKNVHIPDGLAKDVPAFCDRCEKKINAAGGIDLQLLGIGIDGHVGFNELTSSLASRTRIKTPTRQTRKDNARFFWQRRTSTALCDHDGHRHDHGNATVPIAGVREKEGPRYRRRGGGAHHDDEPGVGVAAASEYKGMPRRGGVFALEKG